MGYSRFLIVIALFAFQGVLSGEELIIPGPQPQVVVPQENPEGESIATPAAKILQPTPPVSVGGSIGGVAADPMSKEKGAKAGTVGSQEIGKSNALALEAASGEYNLDWLPYFTALRMNQANAFNNQVNGATQNTSPAPTAPSVTTLPAAPPPSFKSDDSFGQIADLSQPASESASAGTVPEPTPAPPAPTIEPASIQFSNSSPSSTQERIVATIDDAFRPNAEGSTSLPSGQELKQKPSEESRAITTDAQSGAPSKNDLLRGIISQSILEASALTVAAAEREKKLKEKQEADKKSDNQKRNSDGTESQGWLSAPIAELSQAIKRVAGQFFPDHSGKADVMTQKVGKKPRLDGSAEDGQAEAGMPHRDIASEESSTSDLLWVLFFTLSLSCLGLWFWMKRKKAKDPQ